MDNSQFPEIEDLELLRTRKELAELKAKVEKYEQILKENNLLDAVSVISDAELICISQLAKYQKATSSGAVLTLEEVKIVEIMTKTLMMSRGKALPETKAKPKKEKFDNAKLLALAGVKLDE